MKVRTGFKWLRIGSNGEILCLYYLSWKTMCHGICYTVPAYKISISWPVLRNLYTILKTLNKHTQHLSYEIWAPRQDWDEMTPVHKETCMVGKQHVNNFHILRNKLAHNVFKLCNVSEERKLIYINLPKLIVSWTTIRYGFIQSPFIHTA